MNVRYPAIVGAILGAFLTESMGIYPFRSASLAAQAWLGALMLLIAAPYAVIALRADRPSLTRRAFARGMSVTTAAIGILAPLMFAVAFLSIMSGWAEHPHGWERVGQAVGAIVIVPFGFMLTHVPAVHYSPGALLAFIAANIWLAIAVRLSRQEREGLRDAAASSGRRGRRVGLTCGVACGVAMPIVLMYGRLLYLQL